MNDKFQCFVTNYSSFKMRKLLKISCLLHVFLSESDTVTDSCADKTFVKVGEKDHCAYLPGLKCKKGEYNHQGNKCKKCPDGTICDAKKQANFELIPGRYSYVQVFLSLILLE